MERATRARPPPALPAAYLLLLLLLLVFAGRARSQSQTEPPDHDSVKDELVIAAVKVSYVDRASGQRVLLPDRGEDARYGRDSPKEGLDGGTVLVPARAPGRARNLQGCDPRTRFAVPPDARRWIALLSRGNCTFKQKILLAAAQKAAAVVIYHNVSGEKPITMSHEGTGNIIAVMISERRGREILSYIERNFTVLMSIAVGAAHFPQYSRGSLVFVSISFIVLMIISLAWLIFYFIQKFRYANLRGRNQRQLGDVARKATSKLTTRTVKKGDKETDPEFDHCAVCIEGYKSKDVVRILPCKHVFHKHCVDPWLNEHYTCPICKQNILKALGLLLGPDVHCAENSTLDMERSVRESPSNQRSMPIDVTSNGSISLEPLRFLGSSPLSQEEESVPRSREVNVTVTKEWLIIASFGVLSALTLFYMIIKATTGTAEDEYESETIQL
ncbi:E3 ubiquitin-protein ligase RNF130 isoform X3 [Hemiscyllium ocellatum]|uniref:E3 ubiquitin-protein ligase RNF130 isoform X3 n=1 Tax=Hemiscyllium ocellatum TaxID=170820 RepID=UPI0029677691|nr:E3 ubiquitin-protein ligase RNF130 isoform X3 [Hemiscyllium ocellatum]